MVLALAPVLLYCIQKTRMEYYSEFRRKPEEIKEWLEKRRWYERFKTNVQSYLSPEEAEDLLSGQFDLDTISSAFMWEWTPEGIEFWGKCEYQFLRWYYGQWIDFHLMK